MKNSSLLKWTNNRNSRNNKNANQKWLHPPEALQGGHIAYLVKFLGHTEVSQAKGIEIVKEAIRKLKFNQQLKKSEGSKTPKVELTISVDGVAIQQPKSKKIMFQYPLYQISYCADDKAEKRFFSFIAKESDRESHTCFVFVSDKLAEEITLTIGQAFDLAYRRFLETSNREIELRRQIVSLQHQLMNSQAENNALKERLTQIAALKNRDDVDSYMKEYGVSDLLFVKGEHTSVEQPIIHTNGQSESEAPATFGLPPVPPRNLPNANGRFIEDLLAVNDEQDVSEEEFDPRAEETKGDSVTNGGSTSPDLNDLGSDDDFDPRAEEIDKVHKSYGKENSFEIKTPTLDLNGLSPIPALVPPPPRPTRDRSIMESNSDPFSFPSSPNSDVLSQFNEMKVGFSRGLSFGSADADFTLESLDPLKN